MNELIMEFGFDVAENCIFGADINNSMRDTRKKLKKILDYIIEPHFRLVVVNILRTLSPFVVELFQLKELPHMVEFFFYDLLHKTEKLSNDRVNQGITLLKSLLDIKDREIIDFKEKGRKGMMHQFCNYF